MNKVIASLVLGAALAVQSTATWAADHTVNISGFAFAPANIAISAGDTVTFVNLDSAPHTATATDGSFDTGRLGKGDTAMITFATSGTVAFLCEFHPAMRGQVTVR